MQLAVETPTIELKIRYFMHYLKWTISNSE